MRVAINAAIDLRGISGTSRSVGKIRRSLGRLEGVDAIDLLPNKAPGSNKLRNAYEQASWDFWSAAHTRTDVDVLISPTNMGAASRRQGGVLVLHDTMAMDIPELFDPSYRRFFRTFVGLSVRLADVVIVPSHYTERQVRTRWPSSRIVVAPWPLRPALPSSQIQRQLAAPVVLMVGVTEPYKNHLVGIEAVAMCRRATGINLKLALVGPPGRAELAVRATQHRLDPDGAWINRRVAVPDGELDDLYANAWALIQPSVLEGFGLPVAEAAAIGLPTVHSGRGALSEIVDSGVAEPDDPASYAQRLAELLDPVVHAAAAERGLVVKQQLSESAFDAHMRRALLAAGSR